MGAIRLDLYEAVRKGNGLEQLAHDIDRKCADGLQQLMEESPGHWRGEAADAYRVKCELLRQSLLKTTDYMRRTAQAIKAAADEIKRAEEALAAEQAAAGGIDA